MRYHRTFGLDAGQLDELEARIEDILPDPWDKGTGRPKSLSLREAIMVTLLYKRQNIIEEVIADLFGISQGTVSEIITEFTLLIAQATEEFRPDAEEAKQVTRGRLALVDGTLWPSWSWERAPEMSTPRTLGISACSGCCGLRVPCLSWCLFPGCAGGTRAWRDARVSRRVWRAVPRSAFPAGGRFLLPDGLLSWRRLAEAGCEHDDLWFPGDGCLGRGGVREFRACFLGAF